MPSLLELALGFLFPALFSVGLLGAAQRGGERARAALSGIAFGGAWLVAYASIAGLPAWPSSDRTLPARDWLAWVVLLAALSSLAYFTRAPARALAAASRTLLSAGLVFLSLGSWAARTHSWTRVGLLFLALLCTWSLADSWIPRARGPRAPLGLLVPAIGVSVACLLAHSALLAELAGSLAACLGAVAVLAAFVPTFRVFPGASAVILLVLCGCLLNGLVFSDLPLASAALLAAAVVAPGALGVFGPSGFSGRARETESWSATLIGAAVALVPAALAVWMAWKPGDDP